MADLEDQLLLARPIAWNLGLRSWIRVDTSGNYQVIVIDSKLSMMRCCDLPACDLRLLDPSFVYPSTILGK